MKRIKYSLDPNRIGKMTYTRKELNEQLLRRKIAQKFVGPVVVIDENLTLAASPKALDHFWACVHEVAKEYGYTLLTRTTRTLGRSVETWTKAERTGEPPSR